MRTRVVIFERIRTDRRADPSMSQRELARRHHVSRRTVRAALASAVPPPRKRPVRGRPLVLTPVLAVVDEMLRSDLVGPRKQRHTIERICQRLAVEHGFADASYSAVRNYVARRRSQAGLRQCCHQASRHRLQERTATKVGLVYPLLVGHCRHDIRVVC